ncbi:SDR family NAD(P)-dependent oxidoreductase [Amycolatopsis keratiniphila]|uniref:SDR family NAD(P)-dependent oxidoreductase n=1 Tax=Amycolatopsis keratiniphila TaxID=129921 RepID=UPI0033FC3E2F
MKSAIVSGASRGLGLAIAENLLKADVRVAAFARTPTAGMRELVVRHSGNFHYAAVDITDPTAVSAFLAEASDRLGPADALVNNAAIGQDSLLTQTSPAHLESIIATNLTAPLMLTRQFLRRLLTAGLRGRIVTIGSVCAQRGYPGLSAYSATKGAWDSITRSLAREWHGRVLINCVAPGFFDSEMSAVLGRNQVAAIGRRTPTGRLVRTPDLLPVIRMLLLEDTNINGQVLTVDGGGSS